MLFFDREAERTGALDQWREAARLVADRWALYLEARGRCRQWAYASYLAALDAEESAAADLAGLDVGPRGARRSPFPRAA